MKKCNSCNIEKENKYFCNNKRMIDSFSSTCRECSKKYSKKYANKIKIKPDVKICGKCSIKKTPDDFHSKKSSKDGLCNVCKNCRMISTKIYNDKNKGKIKSSNLRWRENNPEYKPDPNYSKNRSKIDPLFKLKRNISSLIRINLKQSSTEKCYKTVDILGCSISDFKKHIESQFLYWMNWENSGNQSVFDYNASWDLDHIIPTSSVSTEEDVYKLNHFSNFQPLCSKINRNIKKDNIPDVCNVFFKNNIII